MSNFYKPPKPDTWSSLVEELTGKSALTIVFQVTENCNMACTYCYQHHKTIQSMSWETAKKVIDKIFTLPQEEYGTIIYEFIGGEPLIKIDLINQICEYTINKMVEQDSPWFLYFKCSICSNGLLYYDTKVQEFFQKYKNFIDFSVSIDGNKELHDSCRIDINNKPTYNKAISSVKHYRDNYGLLNNTKMTLSPDNIQYTSQALINLIEEKYEYIYCNCIFESGWTNEHAQILYDELKILGNYLIDNNLYNKIYIKFFEEEHFTPMSESDNENWCGGICKNDKKYYAIKHDGQVFPCIRYMNSSLNNKQPELPIGNIWNNNDNNYQQNIKLLSNITRRSQSTDECFNCPIAAGCAWCSGYNYEEFGTPNKRATYICCMHKAASLANVYYWNKLYQKLNINKTFKMHLPKEEALKIISEDEYNYLLHLSQE